MKTGGMDELRAVLGEIDDEVVAQVDEGDIEGALAKALAAQEDYDYEAVRNFLKLAVLYSGGDADIVCRLATFLVDDYAIFDEAITILSSSACDQSQGTRRLLARANFLAGHADEALAAYRTLHDEGLGDSLSYTNQGKLLLDANDYDGAYQALTRAVAMDERNGNAQKLLARTADALLERVNPLLDAAGRAMADGDLGLAGERLEEASACAYLPAGYHRLRAQLDQKLAEGELTRYMDQGAELEAAGDLNGALASFRSALRVDESCELAKQKVEELGGAMESAAGRIWLQRGEAALAEGDLAGAVHGFYMAVTRAPEITTEAEDAQTIFLLVKDYRQEVGKVPEKAQADALAALYRAFKCVDDGNLPGAQLEVRRAGSLAEALPHGRDLLARLTSAEQEERYGRALEELVRGRELEEQGNFEQAIGHYERAARAKGFAEADEAAARARELQRSLSDGQARERALSSLRGLLEENQFFLALRDIARRRDLLGESDQLRELEQAAREGTRTKYPMTVEVLEPTTARTRMPVVDTHDFVPEKARFLRATPEGDEYFAMAGTTLFVLDPSRLQAKMKVSLPPQADLTDKKGFILADVMPGDKAGLVVVNFDDDKLLYFQYRRKQFELVNVLPIERFLQQSRRKVTRWYTLNGPQEQIVICQSPQGGGGETRIYGLSLLDGRIEYDDEFGYPLANLRRVPGGESRFVMHRMPEPMLMRRPGYFSMMFLDGRMRVTERLHIGPEDLEGTLIESTRWMRIGETSGSRFFLFRYYDSYTGQLVGRPLAFVALDRNREVVYAAPDSSTLVRNTGDLDAMGEVFLHDGVEHAVFLGRKENEPMLFVVDLQKFKLVEKHLLDAGRRYVGVVPTERDRAFSLVSLDSKEGDLLMEVMEVLQ